ncbi:MAG: 50S ribosomal protein L16 [candidate division CPR1 bacterium GW2011_GWA2_42_17]|uniref:50S ribosomal protein L16 n=1 Tax=candidate division CPR1 bacterium GW2011_GWA2_42_17 TaxID=1618341 RepID=A0A0G0Z5C3_9BACT|nr:MAG: 50S ribosomal protein L16 [candidate division CPR1 bacterium GW2011_GWA2_42_17]
MDVSKPKKMKYPTLFRGRNRGKSWRGHDLEFGDFGLKSMNLGFISSAQIEAARKVIRHYAAKGGRVWIRIFPYKPVTKKPPETRMGSGKAPFDHFTAPVKPGMILFELAGVERALAEKALRLAAHKLSVDAVFVAKEI